MIVVLVCVVVPLVGLALCAVAACLGSGQGLPSAFPHREDCDCTSCEEVADLERQFGEHAS